MALREACQNGFPGQLDDTTTLIDSEDSTRTPEDIIVRGKCAYPLPC